MSSIPKTLEEKAISLINAPGKNIEVYKVISKATIAGRIYQTDIDRIDDEDSSCCLSDVCGCPMHSFKNRTGQTGPAGNRTSGRVNEHAEPVK
ncbi:hypothetical protein A2U01_0040212 [Trifolium medium]|uniref:Uncharacterized protein n=1 Tax=Trifolium medium TaxID=97028 RepID=A0A392Q583_9FABA|nr:hypothetical protein [Trifolium medium]